MKSIISFIVIYFFIFWGGFVQRSDFPILKGPYLGQKPPGMTPEIFAPGIISLEGRYELNSGISLEAMSSISSFLLFVRYGMPESIDGGRGLYISYRRKDGSWAPARNTNIDGSPA